MYQRLACGRAIITGLVAAGCCLADSGVVFSQGLLSPALLPPTGTDVRLGELRAEVEQALGEPVQQVPGWVVTPAIEVDELATDNVLESTNGRRGDLITAVSPSITVHGDTPRVQLDLFYSPSALLYAFTPHQNAIWHDGNAHALVTIVPNELFLDLRGFASMQSATGGFSPAGPVPLSRSNQTQTASGSASPYYVHRFDDYGSIRVGYSFNKTLTGDTSQLATPTQFPIFSNLNLTSNEEYATFRTGENFGRVNDQIWIDAIQESGFGVVQGARRNLVLNQPAYAIDPRLSVYGQIGYEDIAYPRAVPAIRISDVVWAVGFRLTPNADSAIDVRYGHRDGFNSARVDASYALTARTKIFARYSEGLTSLAEEIETALATSAVGMGSNSIDAITGAPVLVTNQLIALQPSLFRVKSLSVSSVTAWPRDTVSLSFLHEEDDLLAISAGSFGFSDRANSATVSWAHSLSERLSGTANVSYGAYETSVASLGSQRFFSVILSGSYAFTETLTGVAQYVLIDRTANIPGQAFIENRALIGLRKSF